MKHFYPVLILSAILCCAGASLAPEFGSASTRALSPAEPVKSQDAASPAPVTQHYDTPRSDESAVGTGEPILPTPPMPKSTTTLVGGTVDGVDRIRDHMAVTPFGGKKMVVHFDERTHIYRDGVETTQLGIHKGDRVYVDTMLDGSKILARNIRVITQSLAADARGQVIEASGGRLSLKDELSGDPVGLTIDSNTKVMRDGKAIPIAQITPGSLITVQFVPGKANQGLAHEIDLLAAPGSIFTFAGRVTNLDLSQGLMSIANQTDNKTYDISVMRPLLPGNLMVGSDVVVKAVFDGKEYKANAVDVTQARPSGSDKQ